MLLVNRSLYCNYIPQELVSLYGSQCVTNFCGNLIEGNCFSEKKYIGGITFNSESQIYSGSCIWKFSNTKALKLFGGKFFNSQAITQ